MAFGHANVTVGTTPTLLASVSRSIYIENGDAAAIFIGGPNVTTTTGKSIAATSGTFQSGDLVGKVYAVSAAGTSANAVRVLFS